MARGRCLIYFKLNEIVESLERQLNAVQLCEPELPGLLAIVKEQRTRAIQNPLKARASKCVPWLM